MGDSYNDYQSFYRAIWGRPPPFHSSTPSFADCERAAGNYNIVRREFAEACENRFPDHFVADDTTRRRVSLWRVEYTWSQWFSRLFS